MKGETSNNHISASRLGFGKIFSDPCNTPLILHNPRVSSKSVYRENPMDFGHPPLKILILTMKALIIVYKLFEAKNLEQNIFTEQIETNIKIYENHE
jgi:hypothetical protein